MCFYQLFIQAKPPLQYSVFDEDAAQSIQKMAFLAKENIGDYITITPGIAETSVELMKFYVDTKKLLYGFPLVTVPPSDRIKVGPSVSQQVVTNRIDIESDGSNVHCINNQSIISESSVFSQSTSTSAVIDRITSDAIIEKILLYQDRIVSASRVAQIFRVSV